MKVAIVGGTGAFGRALARKLRSLDHEVYIGSRDAQRGRERASELGVQGGANEEVVRGADLVVLATKSNATLDTARELVDAIEQNTEPTASSRDAVWVTEIIQGAYASHFAGGKRLAIPLVDRRHPLAI